MSHHYKNVSDIPKPAPFVLSPKMHFLFLGLVVLGVVTFVLALKGDAGRAWHGLLVNHFFWLILSLSGLFFIALQYLVSAMWSSPLKRIPESFIAYLPVALVITLVLLAGSHDLFEWTHHHLLEQDPILRGKAAYLNMPFFVIRNVVIFLFWIGAGIWLVRNSLKQDRVGGIELTKLNKKISAPFIVLFGFTFTVVTFDWLMSLEPHWFSTIFGVYCFAGLFQSGMALMILFTLQLRKQGVLKGLVNENHLHDLGKLMFAFTVFWAYIAFSQYMLIWYANLPEETPWMIRRTEGAWTCVALALLFGKFIVPFFMILSRPAKRHAGFLAFVAVWVLASEWLDIYWIVYPMLGKPVFGWQEIGMFLGFMGLFLLSVTWVLQRIPPVALKDPRLLEGVNHHQ